MSAPSANPPSTPTDQLPPVASSPPPSTPPVASSPPPVPSIPPSSSPPPPAPSLPPPTPAVSAPPPIPPTLSPPPSAPPPTTPTLPPPPPDATPPTPALSPPPPAATPPSSATPPPPLPFPSPPIVPPPDNSPPPPSASSPPPPSKGPPVESPPPAPAKSTPPPAPAKSPPLTPAESPPPPALRPPSRSPPPPPQSRVPPASPPSPTVKLSPPPAPPPGNSAGNPSPPDTLPLTPSGSPPPPLETPSPTNSTVSSNSSSNTGDNNGGIKPGAIVGIGVGAAIVLLLTFIIVWLVRSRRKKNMSGNGGGYVNVMPSPFRSSDMSESSYPITSSVPLVRTTSSSHASPYSPTEAGFGNSNSGFTYEELHEATNGFASHNLLGQGGFGCVYKGCLSDGREVAVKQLNVGGGQGEREFQAEVEIISRVHHRHLVSLYGYCISENQRLLVYEYVQNNTLYYHLHGEGKPVMDWASRVKVAAGAARGLAYLHEDCNPRIIHRDIKSSNILLDSSFEARVSDFGLAKLTVDAQTHVTTRVMGTFGYLAPEYASSGKLTDRSDVFSFGVVLLEIITGRKPVDSSQPIGDESLVEWARPLLINAIDSGNLGELPDPKLQGNYEKREMFRVIEVAAACVRHSAPMRPRMGLVMRALDNFSDCVELHQGMKPGQSELFNSGPNTEDIRLFQKMAFGKQEYSSDFSQSGWDTGRFQ